MLLYLLMKLTALPRFSSWIMGVGTREGQVKDRRRRYRGGIGKKEGGNKRSEEERGGREGDGKFRPTVIFKSGHLWIVALCSRPQCQNLRTY